MTGHPMVDALREYGHGVETHVDGSITVDGARWSAEIVDRYSHDVDWSDEDAVDEMIERVAERVGRANVATANRRAAAARRRKCLAPAMSLRLPVDLDAAIRGSLAPGQTIAGRVVALIRAGMSGESRGRGSAADAPPA